MSRPHDEIEFGEPTYYDCDCCGHRTTKLTRFITRDGDAFAAYYAHFRRRSRA